MNSDRLYLDYNATSPLSKSVKDWLVSGDVFFANPSSQHTEGKAARKVINESRAYLFNLFNKNENQTKLFFHSGATEGIHTFAHSFVQIAKNLNRELLICLSSIDHPAVLSLKEKDFGPNVNFFDLIRDSGLEYLHTENLHYLREEKAKNPNLMILYHHLWVHNETGKVSPLEELSNLKSIPDLFIHVDAVQVPGKITNWRNLDVGDIWTFSAHKFGSLKGVGFSFFNSTTPFVPLVTGGGQQGLLRSGTENIHGVKSLVLALNDVEKINIHTNFLIRHELIDFMRQELGDLGEVVDGTLMASNTIYFYFKELSSDIALALFDLQGLQISAGSACSSGAAKASAVLMQMGLTKFSKNGLRLSLPLQSNSDQIALIKARLLIIFEKIRQNKFR